MYNKNGYTLIELLTVVTMMGILAGLGYSKLTGAVQNARIKDAAINTAAYLERVASDANRFNKPVCTKVVSSGSSPAQRLETYFGSCDDPGDLLSHFELDSYNKFVDANENPADCPVNFKATGIEAAWKFGLSVLPDGCFYIRHGNTEKYAVVTKTNTKNWVFYKLSYDGAQNWFVP